MTRFIQAIADVRPLTLTLTFGIAIALLVSFLTVQLGVSLPIFITLAALAVIVLYFLYQFPKGGFILLVCYCFFLMALLGNVAGHLPLGVGVEVLLVISLAFGFLRCTRGDLARLNNDLLFLMALWLIISILQVVNPADASVRGWLHEIRNTGVYPFCVVLLTLLLFKSNRDLNLFIGLILILALLGSINGIRQLHVGLTAGEQNFLDNGGATTHIVFGKLRVFSFYDAGQFGASQAQFVVLAGVLAAFGPYKIWKRLILAAIAVFCFYGMLISGTRGALFALLSGGALAIFLVKNYRLFIVGAVGLGLFFCVLKFTSIGSGYYEINRMRSALDTSDPSLNVRLVSQQILRDQMSSLPFGGGLGVIGVWGELYNSDKFLSTIQPDSYWVKVWVMYGIVGLTIWFSMIMYILGKCCGIVWNTKDKGLRIKLTALTAGSAGLFFCSYGNEVINNMPSLLVAYASWAFIYLSPQIDKSIAEQNLAKG